MSDERLEPQTTEGDYSPLSELISAALRAWGASHFAAIDGDTVLMFVGFANQVVQDINQHPYRTDAPRLPFYKDPRETLPIPDLIITSGLLHYYALQQHSERVQSLSPQYYRNLNAILWDHLNGNTKLEARPRK